MRKMLFVLFAALALAGCSTPSGTNRNSPTQHATRNTQPLAPAPYTRVAHPDTNTVQLQIALRKFVPVRHRGPAIWLAGTMHVGEPDYYHAVQRFLDSQTVVLYEGVNTGAHKNHVSNSKEKTVEAPPPPAQTGTNVGFSMQSALADSLGLVFQLDAINYDRTNFLNSDLSIAQIQRLMASGTNGNPAAPGQPAKGNPTFDALLQVMDGSSFLGSMFKVGMQFIGGNAKLQAITKLTLIETIGRLKGDFSTLRGLPPDLKQMIQVLIEARNQNVIADVKTELKTVPRSGSVAIFYGTGHMEDLEKRVTGQLHYQPVEEVWLTAFSVDLHRAGLSPTEVQVMRNLVKWQLDQMQ